MQNVVVNGVQYPGWNPFSDPYLSPVPDRIVRIIPSDGPILDIQDPNLACNTGGETGTALVADAPAGSTISMQWTNWPADHLGPVSAYMTACGSDCQTFDVKGAEWFKIDAEGYDNGEWASAKLISDNNSWTVTVPSALAPGQYLIRHEIVALHSTGQPQYYPGCIQIAVSGSGTSLPSREETVQIPGLYDNVNFPDIWTGGFSSFPAPGPPVAAIASAGGPTTTSVGSEATMGRGGDSAPSPTFGSSVTSSPSPGKCGLVQQAHLRRRSH
ncbi:hypothetical protein BD410DRAFT_784224 [Rickenella mellea]|uniref:lytic cellulose monooxygenase (C4-dehydrogenating) n=1 Tax=Rickenella mellea TaxID=50990 RepID=A0A4Y7QH29_9AGAM|nr:hypothetical protein BD410DRAFT_784224 [Rickenella mellea]